MTPILLKKRAVKSLVVGRKSEWIRLYQIFYGITFYNNFIIKKIGFYLDLWNELSGNDYRVIMLLKLYPVITEILLKTLGAFWIKFREGIRWFIIIGDVHRFIACCLINWDLWIFKLFRTYEVIILWFFLYFLATLKLVSRNFSTQFWFLSAGFK